MLIRASLTRFYGFTDSDYHNMCLDQFLGYIDQMAELKRVEKGEKLSDKEWAKRNLKNFEKQMKIKERSSV